MSTKKGERKTIAIKDIIIKGGRRPVDKLKVKRLAKSIVSQQLFHPPHVFPLNEAGKYGLSAGLHRLAAAELLGWASVECVVIDREVAKKWRESENLHRANLSALEQSLAIAQYTALSPNLKGGKQPHDKMISQSARETGFDRKRIADAYRHAGLPNEIIRKLRKYNLGNKRAFLNELCGCSTDHERIDRINAAREGEVSSAKSNATGAKSAKTETMTAEGIARSKAVSRLRKIYQASEFCRKFEQQEKDVRRAFIRIYMR